MKYTATLLSAKDLKQTLSFYMDLFDCTIENDFGTNVALSNGICFQTAESWQGLIGKDQNRLY